MSRTSLTRAGKITTALAIVLCLFQCIYGWQIAQALSVHEYVSWRDQAQASYNRIEDNQTVVVVWYNPEHELHQLVDDIHVDWRDLNGVWHRNVYVMKDSNISLIFCGIYIVILVLVYKRLKRFEENKESYNRNY